MLRLSALVAVLLLVGTGLYVVRDRSRLTTRIHLRQLAYAGCARAEPRGPRASKAAAGCGWNGLSEIRRGDLLGIPFLVLAIALSLILAAKIAHPRADPTPAKPGDRRTDDVMI